MDNVGNVETNTFPGCKTKLNLYNHGSLCQEHRLAVNRALLTLGERPVSYGEDRSFSPRLMAEIIKILKL